MYEETPKISVSIVTGFLGSGKTTLINNLVKQPGMENVALIINEFGEIGLDNFLIESSIENTLLLENGCICCSIRGDLIDTIIGLFTKVENGNIPKFTRIVIETTGLAYPGPIVHTIQGSNVISDKCELSNVVTLVDGTYGADQLAQYQEAITQVAHADLCLISKCDIGSTKKINELEKDLLQINPIVKIKRIEKGQISPDFLFQRVNSSSMNTKILDQHFNEETNNSNHGGISSWSFVSDQTIDEVKFRNWLTMLYTLRPYAMLRMKGVLNFQTGDRSFLIQAVGDKVTDFEVLDSWPLDAIQTRLVLIFKGLTRKAIGASFSRWVLNK